MSSPKSARQPPISKAALVICDAAGNVQAITSKETDDTFPRGSAIETDLAEVFGPGSTINHWFMERIREARAQDEYSAEASLENGDGQVFIRLDSLRRDGQLYGFALQFLPQEVPAQPHVIPDGHSIITRRQWHEIKNHVGAIKLYATFLKRQMQDGDERQIVEKIFNGVNALIGYLDRIRRGESQ